MEDHRFSEPDYFSEPVPGCAVELDPRAVIGWYQTAALHHRPARAARVSPRSNRTPRPLRGLQSASGELDSMQVVGFRGSRGRHLTENAITHSGSSQFFAVLLGGLSLDYGVETHTYSSAETHESDQLYRSLELQQTALPLELLHHGRVVTRVQADLHADDRAHRGAGKSRGASGQNRGTRKLREARSSAES